MITRRRLSLSALALAALGVSARATSAETRLAPAQPFDFGQLMRRAQALAAKPYDPPAVRAAEVLQDIDYDAYQKIHFRADHTLFPDSGAPVRLFHPGRFFKQPVRMHVLDKGSAREVQYSSDMFDYGGTGFGERLPADLGFAGFRAMSRSGKTDWLAFLGASYFRSSGELDQYGPSARGIALDTAMPTPEEFPAFTHFWLEADSTGAEALTIYALLDGPSIAGAYRIAAMRDGAVTMDVEAHLYARKDIGRLGAAPLTSMFWYSESNRHVAADWRPEIHDSDGLEIWTGGGERLWRPLANPPQVMTNSFLDRDPRGFGLMQRDRAFTNYEDDGVFYERRPAIWVEPLEPWGSGNVQLVEIPTDDEIHDNIVAYWVPEQPAAAGSQWTFRYRLHWVKDNPFPAPVARTVATRLGRGGIPGQPRPPGLKKFVVDFAGGPLQELSKRDPVKVDVQASRGRLENVYALQVVGTTRWRAFFDLAAPGKESVDLRLYLRLGERTLTETWLYQYFPFSFSP